MMFEIPSTPKGRIARVIEKIVRVSIDHPWAIIASSLLLCALAMWFISGHFTMTSDTAQLISPNVPWRKAELRISRAFPQNGDTIVVVIDGKTPELAESAAAQLAARLQPRNDLFKTVRRPDAGPFFEQNGLLFLSVDEVQSTTSELVSAQPFLGPMAADTSLRGVLSSVSTLATGVTSGDTTLASVQKPIHSLADALQGVVAGKPVFFSWQSMIAGDENSGLKAPTRRFVIAQPKLNYEALMPGAHATEVVRETARALQLDPAHGVQVRLTGSVPLSDEEFASLQENVWLVTGLMLGSVLLMLWFATKSKRLVAAILITTLLGLVLTMAVGLAAVGRFNLISVAFIPLFVGLGVDFGIQFSVRFRAEHIIHEDLKVALCNAGAGIGTSLALAAAAITLGFFAFLPTNYIGVSELGIIAGLGMVIGLTLALSLLPSLILLFKPRRRKEPVGWAAMAPVDRYLITHRKTVLWAFGLSTVVSIALLPFVHFDFNPMHLRNQHAEAMATLNDLMKDPARTPNTIDVLAPSLPAAEQLAQRMAKLPEVDRAVTLASFVPDEQEPKLAAIADAQLLLDPTLNPFETVAAPTDAETVEALRTTATQLRAAAGPGAAPGSADALRLAQALEALANGSPQQRAQAEAVLIPPLKVMLNQIRNLLLAQPVTLQNLPSDLVRDWVSKDGQARVEVAPRGDSGENATLKRFSAAVLKIAPDGSGAPISTQQAGKTISGAFIEAGLLSLIVISGLLYVALRSIREVAFTLAPIVLAGFLTLGTCVVIRQPINFANIIAFPLLFGVGVAFHIYFVIAWRHGAKDLLQSSLARGVFFSAMTTGMAFGSLVISSHPGTASMGLILMISLIWTLVAALLFEPALLGPPQPHVGEKKGLA